MRKILLIISLLLFAVNITGIFFHPVMSTPASLEKKGIAGYDHTLYPKENLLKMLSKDSDTSGRGFADSAAMTVYYGMFHSEDRRISFFENWLMWIAGKFYPAISKTQDGLLLVKGGAGNCSERTQVLMDIFNKNGLDTRLISLNGHIALEVFFKGHWMVTDPDFGLVYEGDAIQLSTDSGLRFADSVLTKNGFSEQLRNKYIDFWKTTSDNIVLPVNTVSSTRLFYAEKICHWFSWLIPALMLVWVILKRKKKKL